MTLKILFFVFLQSNWLLSVGQSNLGSIKTDLASYKISGRQIPFARNLRFANYQSSKIRRTFGSLNLIGTINPLNTILSIERIPLYHNERYRAKDVFSFVLKSEDGSVLFTECSAILKVRETFSFLRPQDSAFWTNKNHDLLVASIMSSNDTADSWVFMATNLNATNDLPQVGKLIGKEEELGFECKNLILKQSVQSQPNASFLSVMEKVYAFSYKGEIVAAVSVRDTNRKFWILQELDKRIKDVVAAGAVILILRKNLYR